MLLKVIPNFWFLFRLRDGLRSDARQRYWIRECSAEEDIGDIGEELGQMETEVKIALPMSHNDLRIDAARCKKTTRLTRSQPPHNQQLD